MYKSTSDWRDAPEANGTAAPILVKKSSQSNFKYVSVAVLVAIFCLFGVLCTRVYRGNAQIRNQPIENLFFPAALASISSSKMRTYPYLTAYASLPAVNSPNRAKSQHHMGTDGDIIDVSAPSAYKLLAILVVTDLEKSEQFYVEALGMSVLQRQGNDAVVIGYASTSVSSTSASAGLVLQRAIADDGITDSIQHGNGFKGIGLKFPREKEAVIQGVFDSLDASRVRRALDDYLYGASMKPDEDEMKQINVRYGRLSDPDGYGVEIELDDDVSEPEIKKLSIGVVDLDESVEFYEDSIGMVELRRRSNINSKPKDASIVSYISFSTDETTGPYLELVYVYATEKIDFGNGFKNLLIDLPESTDGEGEGEDEEEVNEMQMNNGEIDFDKAKELDHAILDPSGYAIEFK